MSKVKKAYVGFLALCLLGVLAAVSFAAEVTTSGATLKTIRLIEPKANAKWALGTRHSVHFEAVNVATTGYWVKLVRGGQVIGTFAHLYPLSNSGPGHMQLEVVCGELLNGSTYGVGNNYQIQVSTEDGSFVKRGPRFAVIMLTIPD
ncbi:MAG: hypothetical protein MUC72_03165 [Acidobacteria bacterium]|jgi:hypothetical protein|nr:hypothetical protein [Acidobacteriota bacterium]